MRIKGTTRIFRGPHARNRPYQVTLCPKHRPPRPQNPVFSVFTQWVCTLASNRDLTAATWGNDVIRTPTRRRHAGSQLLMLQNPHRRRCGGCRGTAKYGGGAGSRWRGRDSVVPGTVPGRIAGPGTVAEPGPLVVAGRQARQNSPSTAPPPLNPRQNSLSTPQTANFGPFFVRWANYFALAPTIRPSKAKNAAHWARKHERLERKIAPARGVKGRRETFFAHARSQEPFLTHFNRAGAMFLSLRMHARNWSNPLGRYFFQGQTKTTDGASDPDAPNQTTATQPRRCGGRRRDRRARAGFEARRRTK